MSFVFTKCSDCDQTIGSRTNRDPSIYNKIMNDNYTRKW